MLRNYGKDIKEFLNVFTKYLSCDRGIIMSNDLKRFILRLIIIFLALMIYVYIVYFRGIVNMFIPLCEYIAKNQATQYIHTEISKEAKFCETKKLMTEGLYEISFLDTNNFIFNVYVDSDDLDVVGTTYYRDRIDNNIHNKFDSEFNKLFGNRANYHNLVDLLKDWDNMTPEDIDKYSIDITIRINYLDNFDYDNDKILADNFKNYLNENNIEVKTIFIDYFKRSQLCFDYDYTSPDNSYIIRYN